MSQENVEIVRGAMEYFDETGEIPSEYYAEGVEFVTRPDGPTQSVFQGIEGLQRAVGSFRDVWAEWSFEARDYIEGNSAVVVPFRFRLRSQSGVELDVDETWVYWLRDHKISRAEQHGTRQAALKAVDLRE